MVSERLPQVRCPTNRNSSRFLPVNTSPREMLTLWDEFLMNWASQKCDALACAVIPEILASHTNRSTSRSLQITVVKECPGFRVLLILTWWKRFPVPGTTHKQLTSTNVLVANRSPRQAFNLAGRPTSKVGPKVYKILSVSHSMPDRRSNVPNHQHPEKARGEGWLLKRDEGLVTRFRVDTCSAHAKWVVIETGKLSPSGPEKAEVQRSRRMLRQNAIEAWFRLQRSGWVRCNPHW